MSENNAQSSQLFHLFQMMVMMAVDREVVGVIMIMIRGGHADRGLFCV